MEATRQPGQKPGLRGAKIDTCHANLGKSKLKGPLPDFGHERRTIELNASGHHLPIVGTPLTLIWRNEEDTHAFASQLAAHGLIGQAFIELRGDLGAGKTTFVRHLLRALGVAGRIKSPTYAVVEPHEAAGLAIWHFDFYRFTDPREWEDAGFRDVFASPGLKIAEWPDKAAGLLPVPDLVLVLEALPDDTRRVTATAHTDTGRQLLAKAGHTHGAAAP